MSETLSSEQQTAVMRDIGRRRSRTFSIAFVIGWPLSFMVLMLVGLGIVPDLIVSSICGGLIAKAVVRSRRTAIVGSVLAANGISPGTFDPTRYILD